MIILKSQEEIEKITVACRIVGRTLAFLKDKIKPGLKTIQIDRFAADYIRDNDAIPAFKGYRGYPTMQYPHLKGIEDTLQIYAHR